MSAIIVTLFPNPGPRPMSRASTGNRLSHLMALVFALAPLAVAGGVMVGA